MAEAVTWIVAQHVLAHTILALLIMAVLCPILQFFRVYGFAWHAAAYISLFFFAREAAQAERALKPVLGDPAAFFITLWPGNWTAGGARLFEWLAPTIAVLFVAAVTPRRPFLFAPRPEIRLAEDDWGPGRDPRP